MKTRTIYEYREKNNPYANGENISVPEVEVDDGKHYI